LTGNIYVAIIELRVYNIIIKDADNMKKKTAKKEGFGGFDKTSYQNDLKKDLKNKKFREAFEYDNFVCETAFELSRMREHKGLTQRQLAELAGLKRQAVTRLEQGETNMTLATVYKVAKSLGKKPKVTFS
jgi:DNA-binding XRE family transcriptional regulator